MLVYKSDFQRIELDERTQTLCNYWSAKTEDMEEEDYKAEITAWLDAFLKHPVAALYTDTTDFGYTIDPDLQDWNAKLLFPKIIEAGARRWAIVVSQSLFSKISIEQTMEGAQSDPDAFATQYFGEDRKAHEWLADSLAMS